MIGYQMVGTNDYAKALAYYDALFAEIGGTRKMEVENYFVAWGTEQPGASYCVCNPENGEAASVGNGAMTAFMMPDTKTVDKMYAKAIELGGTDEGAPGARGEGFYGGYARDLDGNKFNFFTLTGK